MDFYILTILLKCGKELCLEICEEEARKVQKSKGWFSIKNVSGEILELSEKDIVYWTLC